MLINNHFRARALSGPFFLLGLGVLEPLVGSYATRDWITPSSETSLLGLFSFFHFLSLGSMGEDQVGMGVGGLRPTWNSCVALLAWDSSNASKLGIFFWMTMPFGMSATPSLF